jgi:hypothetical protein
VTTATDCDCDEIGRVLHSPAAYGEDAELRLRLSQSLFAAVAHDLRNTLTGLILWCDTLGLLAPRLAAASKEQDMALYRTVLEQINTLVCRSVHVVDNLLDMSRLQAGQGLPLAGGEVDLVGLAQDVLQSRPETTSSGRVQLESAESELWGWGDADRLARVVDNLVSNAIKYSPADARISVRLSQQNIDGQAQALLEVEDRGIGIPADDLPHVFEAFQRASNVDPGVGGNGLGCGSQTPSWRATAERSPSPAAREREPRSACDCRCRRYPPKRHWTQAADLNSSTTAHVSPPPRAQHGRELPLPIRHGAIKFASPRAASHRWWRGAI